MTEPRIPEVLLFSAGLDSYPAWHYLGRPPGLYFDLGHRYASQERAAVAALSDAAGIEIEISDELRLGAWEAEDAIIPLRNVHLAMHASNRAEMVWCIGVKGDHTLDKSRDAFADMGRFIARFSEKPTRVDSPFWDMTKTDIIAWYLAQGLPVEHLLLTFSCSRTDGSTVHCGRCSSCLRRWTSLVNNGVEAEFEHQPWTWDRVREFYIPAMRGGRYPDHRAHEFFAALATVGAAVAS
ncbi:7-cyano-7-deazaguanine synthase [Kutzneria kofuensis]|uniref:7-cyano-7-deazaguanine synthase n=1 Tax=Kutzneria kofuensis TaxID=103725 RepID=A0A7W9KGQ8_9PSEU|nr:7-cyano-7-deazaguanine synthase [Kutzneria kofuensis]MBB5891888.1 7-cyano-7-deazaguanine synthase in queuosine biosynthesis [Kutzneria kofuensis]